MADSLSSPQDQFDPAVLENSVLENSVLENDDIQFAEETEFSQPDQGWKILIVDDEAEVHEVTKLALSDFTFEGKSLTFISAHSAEAAKALLRSHPDIAIIFLDVVMETENAGLQVINYVREELGNPIVRIILRTGQPGQAPEDQVAVNYGIDDYKTKTELTAQKLFITVTTALRAFSTLMQMLEVSQRLEREVAQYQQQYEANPTVPSGDSQDRGAVYSSGQLLGRSLGRSLSSLPQNQSQSSQQTRIDALGRLVTEIAHEMVNSPNQAGALYTMSMVTRIARMVLRITDEHSTKLGISQSKLAVLMYLSGEPELCASPSTLAKHCGISRAAMTGLLDGLEQEGYVERDAHPSDRRALVVKLTPAGQQFLNWLAPQDQYRLSELMGKLDEAERQDLIELVMNVIRLLDDSTGG